MSMDSSQGAIPVHNNQSFEDSKGTIPDPTNQSYEDSIQMDPIMHDRARANQVVEEARYKSQQFEKQNPYKYKQFSTSIGKKMLSSYR